MLNLEEKFPMGVLEVPAGMISTNRRVSEHLGVFRNARIHRGSAGGTTPGLLSFF